MAQLWSVTCHIGSHSVTCYLTQVNTPTYTLICLLSGGPLTIRTLPIQWDNFMAYADNKEDLARFLSATDAKAPPDNRHRYFHYRVGISSFYKTICHKGWHIQEKNVHPSSWHCTTSAKLLSGFHALTGDSRAPIWLVTPRRGGPCLKSTIVRSFYSI